MGRYDEFQQFRDRLNRRILGNDDDRGRRADGSPRAGATLVTKRFFNLDAERAYHVMMTVHTRGVAVVGVYPFEVAETKVTQVIDYARRHQHPLQCTLEKE